MVQTRRTSRLVASVPVLTPNQEPNPSPESNDAPHKTFQFFRRRRRRQQPILQPQKAETEQAEQPEGEAASSSRTCSAIPQPLEETYSVPHESTPVVPAPASGILPPLRRGQRNRTRQGQQIDVTNRMDVGIHDFVSFTNRRDKVRYESICSKQIMTCKSLHFASLDALGIRTDFEEILERMGWKSLMHVQYSAYVEITREFYTTFNFNYSTSDFDLFKPDAVSFRLCGQRFEMSVAQFGVLLDFVSEDDVVSDWYLSSYCDYCLGFNPVRLWSEWSVDPAPYDPKTTKSNFMKNPIYQCLQRMIALNFAGRRDSSNNLSKSHFFFLWCVETNLHINLAFWLLVQIRAVLGKKSKPLIAGSFITKLAVNLGLLDVTNTNLTLAGEVESFDLSCMRKMGLIFQDTAGSLQFVPPGPPFKGAYKYAVPNSAAQQERFDSVELEQLQQRLARIERSHAILERRQLRFQRNMMAFWESLGFHPPHPSSPSI